MIEEAKRLIEEEKKLAAHYHSFNDVDSKHKDEDFLCLMDNADMPDLSADHLNGLTNDPTTSLNALKQIIKINHARMVRLEQYAIPRGFCLTYLAQAGGLSKHAPYILLAEEQNYYLADRQDTINKLVSSYRELSDVNKDLNKNAADVTAKSRQEGLLRDINLELKNLKDTTDSIAVVDAKMSSHIDSMPQYSNMVRNFYLSKYDNQWSGPPNITELIKQGDKYGDFFKGDQKSKHSDKLDDALCILHRPVDIQDVSPNHIMGLNEVSVESLKKIQDINSQRKDRFGEYVMKHRYPQECTINAVHFRYVDMMTRQHDNLARRGGVLDTLSNMHAAQGQDASKSKEDANAALEQLKHITADIARTDEQICDYIKSIPGYAPKVGEFYMQNSNNTWSGNQEVLSDAHKDQYKEQPAAFATTLSLASIYALVSAVVVSACAYAAYAAYGYFYNNEDKVISPAAEAVISAESVVDAGVDLEEGKGSNEDGVNSSELTNAYAKPLMCSKIFL